MRTVGVGHEDALWLGRRHGAAALSGLVALVASAATAFVLQVGRRRRAGGTETAIGAAPTGTELPPLSDPSDPPGRSPTTPVSGIHDAAGPAPPSAGEQKQSVYGVGFDQHSAHARGQPIAWVVVAVIIIATSVSGINLIMAAPWLFWTGVGTVVLGIILGRTTHAMRDELAAPPHHASSRQSRGGSAQSRLARRSPALATSFKPAGS